MNPDLDRLGVAEFLRDDQGAPRSIVEKVAGHGAHLPTWVTFRDVVGYEEVAESAVL